MTEQEWEECQATDALLEHLGRRASQRKLRLFLSGCCHSEPPVMGNLVARRAVETADRFADDPALADELDAARNQVLHKLLSPPRGKPLAMNDKQVSLTWALIQEPLWELLTHNAFSGVERIRLTKYTELLKDVFGNPFRPVTVDPRWLTSSVLDLARAIYEDRAFERLPILADALQDAGCDSDEIISHCRGPGPHVRGCWLVDLLTGKT